MMKMTKGMSKVLFLKILISSAGYLYLYTEILQEHVSAYDASLFCLSLQTIIAHRLLEGFKQ